MPSFVSGQQAITGIITDFNSYWKTSSSSINPVKPNNSHNLLAFTYNGTQYSTGANNTVLASHGQTFVEGDFWSLPLAGYTGTINSNTKVGLGEMYDGVHNGRGSTHYANNITPYLSDGIRGLDIGTCVANIPAGSISFLVTNIRPGNIGDGIPDIIVTQVADPSGSADKYAFINASGTVVGETKTVVFTNIPAVANWTADFYEASTNPMTLTSGFTNTDRPIRLWGADLSDFGITPANYANIREFKINLSGNSDVAFVAYNNKTFNIGIVLPVMLTDFAVHGSSDNASLNWTTSNEDKADYFVVEKSKDGTDFIAIDTVKAKGRSSTTQRYVSSDQQLNPGINYYRLKIVDLDQRSSYSKTIQIVRKEISIRLFPNPASGRITVNHSPASVSQIKIYTANGILLQQKRPEINSNQTSFDIGGYAQGMYYLVCESNGEKITRSFVIR
ncbi:MAG TPA: T9SS type A sorting domain-containing protein [Chitinophagaceae bacterium]|nr:T9SS type A sorting domain-containing protein [Chitinophagaceae bacterium]